LADEPRCPPLNGLLRDPATSAIYPLYLHDALPICADPAAEPRKGGVAGGAVEAGRGESFDSGAALPGPCRGLACLRRFKRFASQDRKSTRLNSSHVEISYAVFCLKKKKKKESAAVT